MHDHNTGFVSYAIACVTAFISSAAQSVAESFSPMDYLTATGIIFGILGVCVRMYVDLKKLKDKD